MAFAVRVEESLSELRTALVVALCCAAPCAAPAWSATNFGGGSSQSAGASTGPLSADAAWVALRPEVEAWSGEPSAQPLRLTPALLRWSSVPLVDREPRLGQCALPEAAPIDRRTALYVLPALGTAADLATYCAVGEYAIEHGDADAETCLERGLCAWLGRSTALYADLPARLFAATPELRCSLYAGVAAVGSARALEFLADRMGVSDAEDRVILGFVGTRVGAPLDGLPKRLTTRALAALGSRDPGLRREAALALGRVEDAEAVPALAALLGSTVHSDQTAAAWALRHITGLAFAAQSETWHAWWEREQKYWDERGEEQLSRLGGMNRKQQSEALRELVQHPWRRADIARGIAPLLACDDAKVEHISGLVLAELGGSVALATLRQAADQRLEDPSAPVHEALARLEPEPPRLHRRKHVVGARGSSSRTPTDR
jgi:hypothetical protein